MRQQTPDQPPCVTLDRETLVRLAIEAGFVENERGELGDGYWSDDQELTKFALLVASAVRERCAQIAEETDDDKQGAVDTSAVVAARIRRA